MEELLPLLIFVAWLVLSLLGRLARRLEGKKQADAEPAQPSTFETVVRDLMREVAGEEPVVVERPTASERPIYSEPRVPSEHRPTPGEHRPTMSEHVRTYGETRRTVSEHLPTVSETRRTFSEHVPTASERVVTAGEHLRGDLRLPPLPVELPPVPTSRRHHRRQRRSRFAGSVVSDLKGRRSLARAVLLREILDPPVGLRSPGEDQR